MEYDGGGRPKKTQKKQKMPKNGTYNGAAGDERTDRIDSQSVKASPQRGPGYDAGKKVKGRKRSLMFDTLVFLLAVVVSIASVQDRDAVDPIVEATKKKYQIIVIIFAYLGYQGDEARKTQKNTD